MNGLKHHTYRLLAWVLTLMLGGVSSWAQINTDQVISIGRNALYFEDYVLAIQYFNQVINAKPFLAEPYFYRSVAKISLEDYLGAQQDATQAIERNPFIVDAYQVRGVSRQNMRDFKGAVEDYDAGLKLMPEDKVLLMNRAVCLAELKDYDAAQDAYNRLLQLDPKNDRAYMAMAHMNLMRADTAAALQNLNRSIALSKNNAAAYVMRAEIATRSRQDFESACADMDSAILLEPRYAGYFINRAYMKYNLDDYFGAMADYDYAIVLDPSSVEAHFNRGLLRAEVSDNNKAIEDFNFVLKNNAGNFMALYNRALLYMRTGQYKQAAADFTSILKKYPEFEAGYMARGEARRRMGDMRGSNADYDHAMAIFKRHKTHVSTFDPAQIEATAAVKKAQQRALEGDEEPETAEDIMNRFNMLLTVAPQDPVKPEYANSQRGHIQNTDVEVEPMPVFSLSYHAQDNKLNGNTYYVKEVSDANDLRLLPGTLTLVSGNPHLGEDEIKTRFASIEYYNAMLASSKPRAIDYFGRGLDYLLVKNPAAAITDADRAIALSPDMALAYLLRADARYLQYRMARAIDAGGTEGSATAAADHTTDVMLRQREDAVTLDAMIEDLDQVIKRSPKNVYAYFNKGNAYMLQGDYTSAISCYGQAIELKPDLGQAYYNRGLMYLRMGNKSAGVADLSKAGELGIMPSYNVLKRMSRR